MDRWIDGSMGRWVESLGDQSGEGGNSGKKRVKVVAEASYATTTPKTPDACFSQVGEPK
jgi:hypothetical protein